MNTEKSQKSFSEGLTNATRQLGQNEDFSGLPSIQGISLDAVLGEEMLPRQKDNLRRAQSEYSLGRYDEARSILEKIAKSLESALLKRAPESADWEQNMGLAASTLTLLGCTYARLHLDDESVRASARAIELFDALKRSKCLSGVEINDLGIALQLAGHTKQSVAMLQEAANLSRSRK